MPTTSVDPIEMGVPRTQKQASVDVRPVPAFVRARIVVVRACLAGCIRLFGLNGLYLMGRFFGTLEYLTDYNRRRRVHTKLKQFFKDRATPSWRRRVTRQYFMRIRCDKMFYTIMDRIPRDQLLGRIEFIGREHVNAALARNKGLFAAMCHFGSQHVAGLMMALMGYRLAGVRDPKESHVRRYIQRKYRETFPEIAAMKMFYSDAFPRELFRYYRDNEIVASLLDVDRARGQTLKTYPVSIFGETRDFLTGPLKIAIRCKATVLQGFVISRPNFHYQIISTPPLFDPEAVEDEEQTVAAAIQTYADRVEQHAREHPDHLMKI